MRALAIVERGAAPLVTEVDERPAGPGEIVVAVDAASLNGFDLAVVGSYVWAHMPRRAASRPSLPRETPRRWPRPQARRQDGVGARCHPGAGGPDDVVVLPIIAASTAEKLAALLDLVASGHHTAPVDTTFPLGRAVEALGAFRAPKLGNIVITVP